MLTAVFSPLQALEGANAEARIEVSVSVHPFGIMQPSRQLMLRTSHQHLVRLSTCQLCCCIIDALAWRHCAGIDAHQRAAELFRL